MSQDNISKDNSVLDPSSVKPKKRDRGASEERLLNAAIIVFSKYGFNGATTKMIAKKADVNESLIGRYFDGKAGLLVAIIHQFMDENATREAPYAPQNSLREELEHYVKDRLHYGCKYSDIAKIIISQALIDKKFKNRLKETTPMRLDPRLLERVTLLFQKGLLKSEENIMQICTDVNTFMDGIVFFGSILQEKSGEELQQCAIDFIHRYCQIYK